MLIVLSLVALVYQGITYTTRQTVIDVGRVHATADRQKTLPLPPVLGCGVGRSRGATDRRRAQARVASSSGPDHAGIDRAVTKCDVTTIHWLSTCLFLMTVMVMPLVTFGASTARIFSAAVVGAVRRSPRRGVFVLLHD